MRLLKLAKILIFVFATRVCFLCKNVLIYLPNFFLALFEFSGVTEFLRSGTKPLKCQSIVNYGNLMM